jgi:hypothetical protein
MKKVPLWRMILLQIVTLGFYEFYWLSFQKKYLEKKTKKKLPSNKWLLAICILVGVAYAMDVVIYFVPDESWVLILTLFIAVLVLIFAAAIIRFVWVILFLRAASKVLEPRMTFVWLLILHITLGVGHFVAQHYANKKADPKQKAPTRRFIVLSIVSIVLFYFAIPTTAFIIGAVYIGHIVANSQTMLDNDPRYSEFEKKADLLSKQYDGCVEELDATYRVVTDENVDAYSSAYDACEAIRIEQNKAVDDRDARSNELLKDL